MFDVKARRTKKKRRQFERPEFQKKLARARRFARKPKERPAGLFSWLLERFGFRRRLTRILATLILILLVYFLTISSTFLVTEALVEDGSLGEAQVEEVLFRLQKKRTFLIPKNHILLLDKDSFLGALRQEVPNVRSLTSYRRVLPGAVRVGVEKREPKYIWQTSLRNYFIDQDGVVFQEVFNYDPAVLQQMVIEDKTGSDVVVGEQLRVEQALNFLASLEEIWPELISETAVSKATLPGNASIDVFVTTDMGFEVFFDLNRGARGQLENLRLLLTQEINPETYGGLAYIDLRLSNVGYYCYKDAACVSQEALEEEVTSN